MKEAKPTREPTIKPADFLGSTLRDLREMPEEVRREFGFAIDMAQNGLQHPNAKPLRGFGSAGVLEVVERHDGNAYRAVYTVKFEGVVYVLHVFQKKSTKGIATPKPDMDLIERRLKEAAQKEAAKAAKEKKR